MVGPAPVVRLWTVRRAIGGSSVYIFAVSRYKVISLEGTCKITAGNFELVLISSRWLTPQLTDKLSSLYKPSLFNSRTRTVRCR